jgi:hypothetical protein
VHVRCGRHRKRPGRHGSLDHLLGRRDCVLHQQLAAGGHGHQLAEWLDYRVRERHPDCDSDCDGHAGIGDPDLLGNLGVRWQLRYREYDQFPGSERDVDRAGSHIVTSTEQPSGDGLRD